VVLRSSYPGRLEGRGFRILHADNHRVLASELAVFSVDIKLTAATMMSILVELSGTVVRFVD
jgi:hypothetical protein